MLAKIHVKLKDGVLDTQGNAVHHALNELGYQEVKGVNLGKYVEVKLDGLSQSEAEDRPHLGNGSAAWMHNHAHTQNGTLRLSLVQHVTS